MNAATSACNAAASICRAPSRTISSSIDPPAELGCAGSSTTVNMKAYLPEPARQRRLLIENQELQIILGKVRLFTSPGRGPSTGFDHCSSYGRECRRPEFVPEVLRRQASGTRGMQVDPTTRCP